MNLFNTLELDFSPTLKKILSIMKLTVVFLIECSKPINKGSPLFDRKSIGFSVYL